LRTGYTGTGIRSRSSNAPPRRFGLVAGADGLHSAVRRLSFGPESRWLKPLGCYTAWFTAPGAPDLDDWFEMHQIAGGLVASLRPGSDPNETKAALSFRDTGGDYDRRDGDQQRELIAQRFAGASWRVPGLLDAMHRASDFAFDTMAQVHLDRWTSGRIALVGDAGYCPTPLSGLGTSLALVGSYLLAGELAVAGDDHATALARYEQLMRPYVATAQQLPPGGLRGYAPRNRIAIALQSQSMRSMQRWPIRPMLARVFAKASSINLPEYPIAS
jgi:2-polyprenyl-6-methoxyphenol hydroxylase-like FAD-dependent oxidoreductase